MRATYVLSQDDLAAFLKIITRRFCQRSLMNPTRVVFSLLGWGAVGSALEMFRELYAKYPVMSQDLTKVAVAAALGVILLLCERKYVRSMVHTALRSPDGLFFAEQTLEVSAAGIRIKTRHCDASYQWSAFLGLEQDSRNLYLFFDSAEALILPKAVLGSEESILQIESWWQAGAGKADTEL